MNTGRWMGRALLSLCVLLLAPNNAAGEVRASEEQAVRFAELVRRGDQLRTAGNLSEALRAYDEALAIRRDPVVEGRIGLIMLEAGQSPAAARYLLRAIVQGDASDPLMDQFHKAFARVKPKVCYVDVTVSEFGAEVTVDGEQEVDSSDGRFFVFVLPGKHVFRAKKEGFEDAVQIIEARPRETPPVVLTLKALAPKALDKPAETPRPEAPPRKSTTSLPSSPIEGGTFVLGAGAALVVGATPGAAIGPRLSAGWRRQWFSVELEARGAWALATPSKYSDLRLLSWAVGAAPCAYKGALFDCAFVQVDWLVEDVLSPSIYRLDSSPRFGLGLRGGLDVDLGSRVHLRLFADGGSRSSAHRVVLNTGPSSRQAWEGSSLVGAVGVTALMTF